MILERGNAALFFAFVTCLVATSACFLKQQTHPCGWVPPSSVATHCHAAPLMGTEKTFSDDGAWRKYCTCQWIWCWSDVDEDVDDDTHPPNPLLQCWRAVRNGQWCVCVFLDPPSDGGNIAHRRSNVQAASEAQHWRRGFGGHDYSSSLALLVQVYAWTMCSISSIHRRELAI